MMRWLRHWKNTALAALLLAAGFYRARQFYRRHTHLLPSGLSAAELRRTRHYVYGTAYLNAFFCRIFRHRRSHAERLQFLRLSALACYFDDLSDRALPASVLEIYAHANDRRGIALSLLQAIRQQLCPANAVLFQASMQQVFEVETSGRQRGAGADWQETLHTTRRKGSASVMMFRCLLAPPVSAAEHRAVSACGALIQLSDDIFDAYFDLQAGVHTVASILLKKNDPELLAQLFETRVLETRRAVEILAGDTRYTPERALAVLHFLVTITRTCLQHYQALQKKHGHLPLQQRQLMVLDMDLQRNRFRAARLLFARVR